MGVLGALLIEADHLLTLACSLWVQAVLAEGIPELSSFVTLMLDGVIDLRIYLGYAYPTVISFH